MENFPKISGHQGNEINILENTTFGKESSLEFKTFFNGKGGTGNLFHIGKNCKAAYLKVSIQGERNKVEIQDNCQLNGLINIGIIGSDLKVIIGKNCIINGAFINCREQDIIIGEDCLLSNEIKIRSSDAHQIFDANTHEQINRPHSPVLIGNHVWVGQGVFIGKNAQIADGCVIATRSVITKKLIEPNCIIGGVGGSVLRHNIYWKK